MYVVLVDATFYQKELDENLRDLKEKYFKIKNHVRKQIIGDSVQPSQRNFSIGLLRIGTILKENNCQVKYISILDDVVKIVREETPDVVAFSAVCPTIDKCALLAKEIRKSCSSKIRIVIGGAHLNVAHTLTKNKYKNIFDEYLYTDENISIKTILGKKTLQINKPINYVDYSLLPLPIHKYSINTFRTLGCVFDCQYCQDKKTPYFERDIKNDISFFVDNLSPKTLIHFFDSSIIGNDYSSFVNMCKLLKDMKHGMLLSCDIRPEQINEEVIELLMDAGFVEIRVGVESGSNNILKKVNRSMEIEKITKRLENAKKYSDLYISIYILSGLIGSEINDCEKTHLYINQLITDHIVDEVKNGIYVPYPMDGVNYSDIGLEILNFNWSDYDRQSFPVYRLKNMSSQEIWDDFLLTTKTIVKAWMHANNITEEQLESLKPYNEYNIFNYKVRK